MDLALDGLTEAAPSLDVGLFEQMEFGSGSPRGSRDPHRHDYHELIWTREGSGRHLIDGEISLAEPNTLTLIGRGQVHSFERAQAISGAVIRFKAELVYGNSVAGAGGSWLAGLRITHRVAVPEDAVPRLEWMIQALAEETRHPADACSIDLQHHLLAVLLFWVERWFGATQTGRRDANDPELRLYHAFVEALERDFARHHSAVHYADVLGVPQAALSRALARSTGRTTKELIVDRRMLEAARLLRFTDINVGEVAYRAGFRDQLYFSRAFKRATGEAPSDYRRRVRGLAREPDRAEISAVRRRAA
jgi:AraC family transcriptional activator of pobA